MVRMDIFNFITYSLFYFTLAVYTMIQAFKSRRFLKLWSSLEKNLRVSAKRFGLCGNSTLKENMLETKKINWYLGVVCVANSISGAIVAMTIYNAYSIITTGDVLYIPLDATLILLAIACNILVEIIKTGAVCDISSMQYNLHVINYHSDISETCNKIQVMEHN